MSIGFYSPNPIILPHPPYSVSVLRIVESAIIEAWRIIKESPQGGFDVTTANEDRITRELLAALINTVLAGKLIRGFTDDVFYLVREAKFDSYNGRHLDKMPDLHVRIVSDRKVSIPSVDGLFIECKPVDIDHPAGSTYCDKGILRFVTGEYAWATSQALMVGYASDGYELPRKLVSAVKKRANLCLVGQVSACASSVPSLHVQVTHATRHSRPFVYPDTGKGAPIIVLRHVWLKKN